MRVRIIFEPPLTSRANVCRCPVCVRVRKLVRSRGWAGGGGANVGMHHAMCVCINRCSFAVSLQKQARPTYTQPPTHPPHRLHTCMSSQWTRPVSTNNGAHTRTSGSSGNSSCTWHARQQSRVCPASNAVVSSTVRPSLCYHWCERPRSLSYLILHVFFQFSVCVYSSSASRRFLKSCTSLISVSRVAVFAADP